MIPTTEDSSEPSGFVAIVISGRNPKASSCSTIEIIATAASKARRPCNCSKRLASSQPCHLQSSNCPSWTTSRMERSRSSVSSEVIKDSMCSENALNFPRPLSTLMCGPKSSPNYIKSRSISVKSWLALCLTSYLDGSPLTPEKGKRCSDTC